MKKQLVFVYTRINGVEKVKSTHKVMPAGYILNKGFHEALGLKVGER